MELVPVLVTGRVEIFLQQTSTASNNSLLNLSACLRRLNPFSQGMNCGRYHLSSRVTEKQSYSRVSPVNKGTGAVVLTLLSPSKPLNGLVEALEETGSVAVLEGSGPAGYCTEFSKMGQQCPACERIADRIRGENITA
jgi:hypothetical protein